MITDPRQYSAAICGELEIDPTANAAHLARWSRRVQNSNNNDFIEAKTSRGYSRPDHQVRIDRWRENLTRDEVAEIWDIAGETAREMGYSAPVPGAG